MLFSNAVGYWTVATAGAHMSGNAEFQVKAAYGEAIASLMDSRTDIHHTFHQGSRLNDGGEPGSFGRSDLRFGISDLFLMCDILFHSQKPFISFATSS